MSNPLCLGSFDSYLTRSNSFIGTVLRRSFWAVQKASKSAGSSRPLTNFSGSTNAPTPYGPFPFTLTVFPFSSKSVKWMKSQPGACMVFATVFDWRGSPLQTSPAFGLLIGLCFFCAQRALSLTGEEALSRPLLPSAY